MNEPMQANVENCVPRPCPFCAKQFLSYELFDSEEYLEQGFVGFRLACSECYTKGPLAKIVLKDCIWPLGSQEFIDAGGVAATELWNVRALSDTLGESMTTKKGSREVSNGRWDYTGKAGIGFKVDLADPATQMGLANQVQLVRWSLVLPGQSVFWSRYVLAVCHLREMAGFDPPKKVSPGMTHELAVLAIDPSFSDELFQHGSIQILTPNNHAVQFRSTDELAVEVGDIMAKRLIDGLEFAEPGGIQGARVQFGRSLHAALAGLAGTQLGG